MPRVLMPGVTVGRYRILERVSDGAFAISYKAESGDGPVFLKQYKMPTITTAWYAEYVKYQAELKRRVETTHLKNFTYQFVDFFEETVGAPCYFQVFEFVEHGQDLRRVLDQLRDRPRSISWQQRVIFAKVMMAGINALHAQRIVHCDLKPDNIELIAAAEIAAKYTLKIVDMDFSILADKRPPWHADQDFQMVGTPGYMSPEHIRGELPVPASDVFTCGLMLYELLAGGHPYAFDSPQEYSLAAVKYRAKPPALGGFMSAPADTAAVVSVIHSCLDPNPANRPTAQEVNETLNGRLPAPTPAPPARPVPRKKLPASPPPVRLEPRAPKPVAPKPPITVIAKGSVLVLTGPSGRSEFRIRTSLGQRLLCGITNEPSFWASEQCTLVPSSSGWSVEPNPSAPNETLVNGRPIVTSTALEAGDVLAVGRHAKGVTKAPLKVSLE